MLKRGDNIGNAKARVALVPLQTEMEAVDKLGPRARFAIVNNPLKFTAAQLVADIEAAAAERGQVWDLQNPRLDRMIAEGIVKDTLMTLLRDRSEIDARSGLNPLKPKPGTVRQGRRIYR